MCEGRRKNKIFDAPYSAEIQITVRSNIDDQQLQYKDIRSTSAHLLSVLFEH
jgi:hypothetical protein